MKTKKKNFPVQAIELAAAGVSADTQGLPHPEEFDDLTEAFGIHTWVYACANLIANSFAMIEFLPYVQDKDGSWVVNEKHPFRKVLQHPNPNMSGVEFRRLFRSVFEGLPGLACDSFERFCALLGKVNPGSASGIGPRLRSHLLRNP
jgi:hypothetical protein